MTRQPRLGSGQRFKRLEGSLSHRQNVRDPGALAASIGRKKYGKQRFQELAAAGQRHHHSPTHAGPRYKVGDVVERTGPGGGKVRDLKIMSILEERDIGSGKPVRYYRLQAPGGYTYAVDERHLEMNYRPHPPGCNCPFHQGHPQSKCPAVKGIGRRSI